MKKKAPKHLAIRILLAIPLVILMVFGLLCSLMSIITSWLEVVSYNQFDAIFHYATGNKFTEDKPK